MENLQQVKQNTAEGAVASETFVFSATDERIAYPSFMSFDDFIDVAKLRSLDEFLRQRICERMDIENDTKFYTGPYRLQADRPDRPGSRMIYLSSSNKEDSYFDLDCTELWKHSAAAAELTPLMDFIATLPFESTGRMLIMYDGSGSEVPAHRDHIETEMLHEFIWFRTNTEKPFYMLNAATGEKKYVRGHSAWFDTVNQFHGSDATGDLSFSIRVDGKFTEAFRKQIPSPAFNAASTPSLWAAIYEQGKENDQEVACLR